MQFNLISLSAGIRVPLAAYGRYFLVYTCTGTITVEFEYEDGTTGKTDFRQRRGGPTEKTFKNIWVTSPIDQVLDVGWSDQVLVDNDIGGSVTAEGLVQVVSSGATSYGEKITTLVAVTVATVLVVNSNRMSATFTADTGGNLWHDNTASATKGIPYTAGALVEIKNTAALYFFPTAAGTAHALEDII